MHSEDAALVSRTHKQQTTQQVTTVTKVVREVKHLGPDGQQVDYVAMPLDVPHLGADGQPVDYVAMPLGMYPRLVYLFMVFRSLIFCRVCRFRCYANALHYSLTGHST